MDGFDLPDLMDLLAQETRRRPAWGRLVGILLTILFVLLSSIRRSRSTTVSREQAARGAGESLAYEPIEPRGFPAWIWWGFLVTVLAACALVMPAVESWTGRLLLAGGALLLLVLLRVLGGRAGSERPDVAASAGDRSDALAVPDEHEEEEDPWISITRGST